MGHKIEPDANLRDRIRELIQTRIEPIRFDIKKFDTTIYTDPMLDQTPTVVVSPEIPQFRTDYKTTEIASIDEILRATTDPEKEKTDTPKLSPRS